MYYIGRAIVMLHKRCSFQSSLHTGVKHRPSPPILCVPRQGTQSYLCIIILFFCFVKYVTKSYFCKYKPYEFSSFFYLFFILLLLCFVKSTCVHYIVSYTYYTLNNEEAIHLYLHFLYLKCYTN